MKIETEIRLFLTLEEARLIYNVLGGTCTDHRRKHVDDYTDEEEAIFMEIYSKLRDALKEE